MVKLIRQDYKYIPSHFLASAREELLRYYVQEPFPQLHRLAELMSSYMTIGGLARVFDDPHAFEQKILTLPSQEMQRLAMQEWYFELEGVHEYYMDFVDDLELFLLQSQMFYGVFTHLALSSTKYDQCVNVPIRSVW